MNGWHLMIEDGQYFDPTDVIFRLVKFENGKRVASDAMITSAEHGLIERLQEACGHPILRENITHPDPIITIKKA